VQKGIPVELFTVSIAPRSKNSYPSKAHRFSFSSYVDPNINLRTERRVNYTRKEYIAMNTASHPNNTPLLLLLDGVLSQDEESTDTALKQMAKLDPKFQYFQSSEAQPADSINFVFEYRSPLHSASRLEAIVERFLIVKPDLARVASESDGSLPLHFAASIGNIRVASVLLNNHRDAALMHNTKGKIPLHYAAREGRSEMVKFLLRLVPLCAVVSTKKGKLALHFASGEGHTEVVRDLLRVYPSGAASPSKKGKVPLHFAARWGHIDIARDLFQLVPECIKTLDYDGSNPLHDATREGQFEMAKFLVERYPPAMYKSNIRGEIPLFAAIRSGNKSLCAFLIRSWPGSGKQVLQAVTDPDDVISWEPAILNLCLRGAVGNFTDLSPEELRYTDDQAKSIIDKVMNNDGGAYFTQKPYQLLSDKDNEKLMELGHISPDSAALKQASPGADLLSPRCKSPILVSDDCGKKRSSSSVVNSNKRQHCGSTGHDDKTREISFYQNTLQKCSFYQVHTALECSATTNVLECILERYPEQRTVVDDYGRLPLHIAMSQYRSRGYVDFVLEHIWEPNQNACFSRDFFGRLPLHLALMARADSRLVKVLLDMYPSSGTERCPIVDEHFSHMLPIQMAILHGCDLSTLFMLVRQDPAIVKIWGLI